MYKNDRVTLLLFMSTLGFSQNKIGGSDPISGIDIIIKTNPGSKRIMIITFCFCKHQTRLYVCQLQKFAYMHL
jgi:hypothetical protein